jgi:hypothetical protein
VRHYYFPSLLYIQLFTHLNIVKNFSVIFCSAAALAIMAQANTYTFQPLDTISGDTNHHDLGDLSHTNAYTWGINGTSETSLKNQLTSGYHITSATITIKNIYNWDRRDTDNQLFIHLLDNPLAGVKTIGDDPYDNGINQGTVSDYFSGKISGNKVGTNWIAYGYNANGTLKTTGATNIYLTQFHDTDGPTTVSQLVFHFTSSEITTLANYIGDGHTGGSSYADLGLGFDPDCHFFNDGVTFCVTTAPNRVGCPDGGMTLALFGLGLAALAGFRRFNRS